MSPPDFSSLSSWERCVWNEEAAWSSVRGNVRAIVSEARSRLIYLGAADGSSNLLNAPRPDDANPHPNQGGHRFWLGPQHHWIWPPPTEWEYAPAVSASVDGGVFILGHAQIDPNYPALTREYAWEGNRLRCTVRWADDGRLYFGMHVLAVDSPFAVTVRLERCDAVPDGLVLARMVDPVSPIRLPHPAISLHDGRATVSAGIQMVKLGFAPQPLIIGRSDGWNLAMHPGPCGGVTGDMPDLGYLSQVWVGDESSDFAEIEQLTPQLRGDSSGQCSSTVYIEARFH